MKWNILILLFLLPALTLSAQDRELTADEIAIMDVIEKESAYFWARDYRNWKKTWVHEDYIVWTVATRDGVQQYRGWNDWNDAVVALFSDSPSPQEYNVNKYEFQFRVYGDCAWVTFTQDTGDKSRECRFLEKHDGQWKIAFVEAIFDGELEVEEQQVEE